MKKSTNFLKVIIYIITYHLKKRTGRVILKLYREMWCKNSADSGIIPYNGIAADGAVLAGHFIKKDCGASMER